MRLLVILVALLAALYSGYWFVGRAAVDRGTAAAIGSLETAGWEIAVEDRRTVGFPSRFDTTLTGLRADAPSGYGWSAPRFGLFAMSWQPRKVIAVWPERQELRWPGGAAEVTSSEMRASATLGGGTDVALDHATLEAEATTVALRDGPEVALSGLLAALRPAGGEPLAYDVFAEAREIALPAPLSGVATLSLDGTAVLDRALDRHAFTGPRPRPERIALRALRLDGPRDLTAEASGDLTVAANGRLSGGLTVETGDWGPLLDTLVGLGAIEADRARQVEPWLGRLAGDGLSLPLDLKDGVVSLGPVPLGEAPRWPVGMGG